MAEYAGLEIRIGGNTTKLTNALKAPTKSAAELQRRIRQITNAMQFDPHNLENVATRIKLTGDRMQSLQSKAQITRDAMRQLGDTMVKFGGDSKSIRDIANETDNLSLAAKQADERFNNLGDSLAKIYEAWNRLAREKGADYLMNNLGFSRADADHYMSSAATVRDLVAELRRQQQEMLDPMYEGARFTDAEVKMAKRLKQIDFHDMFRRGLDLDDILAEADKIKVGIEDSAVSTARDLQKAFKGAQEEKKALDEALRYEQMGTDLQRLDSEAESLSQTMRRLDDTMTEVGSSERFQDLAAEIRKVDAALDNVEHDLERTGEAMKVDPDDIQLAARYYNDLQQKADLAKQKTELLESQMAMLDGGGASEAAKQHQDLAKWVEESAEAARVANKELSDQRATVANLTDQTESLSQAIKMARGDELLAGYSDKVMVWKRRTQDLSDAMDGLAFAEKNVVIQHESLDNAQSAFDKAKATVERYEKQLEDLRAEYERLDATANDSSLDFDTVFANYERINELTTEIQQAEIALKGAKQDVEDFGKELREQQDFTKTADSLLVQRKERVEELKAAVADLEKTREVKLFKNPGDEIEKAEAELKELQGELDEATAKERELASAYDSAKTENELAKTAQAARDVSSEMDETRAAIKKANEEMKSDKTSILNPSTIKSIGMTLSATITPALAGLGYKMVDASSEVDSAYRDMRKTVEGTEEQFEHLRSAAIDFSRTHVTSADQILQIEAIGGELGVATENLETFAEVISNIDVATNLDAESAATALGHLSNILHLTESDYTGFSDALVRLGNNGASTETEIVNVAERIGSMGSIVGMSGSDILAWASTIASTGQRAEAAGTAISRTMSFMETAVAAAGGSIDTSFEAINAAVEEGGDKLTVYAGLMGQTVDEFTESWETGAEEMAKGLQEQMEGAKDGLQTIADVAHMSADEFIKAWESDPTEVLKAFIEGLNDIEGAEGSADRVLQDLGIKAVRQKQAIEGLMQTIGGLNDNLQMSENAWNGVSDKWGKAGDAANEAAKKAEGFSGKVQILKNMWQNFLSELGEGAVPWIQMFTDVVSGASKTFSTFTVETKKWIVAAGGIVAALGPMLSFAGTTSTAFGELSDWFKETTNGFSFVKMAVKHFGKESAESFLKTATAMDKLKLVGLDLGSSLMSALKFGAITAGIVLVAYELKKLYDRHRDHIAATKGLSDALAGIGNASDITSVGVEHMGTSLRDAMVDSEGYESRLADLAKTLEDSNRQYGTYAGQLNYYADTIRDLGGKADRSQEETYKLEAALQAVNDACSTTYGLDEYGNIIDTETGKVVKNTDAILANIDARRAQALLEYYGDDYAQAVGEYTDAQDKLNEAIETYNDLASDQGKQDYLDFAKKTEGAFYDEEKALSAYELELGYAKNAMDNYQLEVNKAGDVVSGLESKMASATEEMDKANKVIEDAALAQAELDKRSETVTSDVTGNMKKLSKAVNKAGGDDAGFNAIAEGLDTIHVYAKELDNVDMKKLVSAFDSANGSMTEVVKTLEEGGVHMTTWTAALEQAPGAADKMSSVTSAAFQSMYEVAGSDLNATMTLIAGMNTSMASINGQQVTFYIGDNGSIIDEQGRIYDIKNDLASIPNEVITAYYVDDKDALQTALDTKAALNEVGDESPKPTINLTDNATRPTETLQSKLRTTGATVAKPTANLRDNVSVPLSNISRRLDSLNGRVSTVTINTVEKRTKQATGGMNNRPVIPEHASGYIATGPTLTNQGWIGEDGIEAVANWATGGAVVPLTNKRYMLPIADAIADGMAARGGGQGATYNMYVNDAKVNDDAEIQAAMLNLFDVMMRKGAMNRG